MKSKRRIIATAVAVLISFAAALPAAAQETDSAPATGMEADVFADQEDTNGFADDSVYPFVLEKLSREDFEKAAAEVQPAEEETESGAQDTKSGSSDGEDDSDQAFEEFIYENDVLEIGGGFWRISTPEMTSSRIVISGDAGIIFCGVDVLSQDGAAMTVAPGADVRIILEQGSISYLMGAAGYPAISLADADAAQDSEEGGDQEAALTVYGCGCLTAEGGSGCAAIEGRLVDRTIPDPLEEDAEYADVERISFIDNYEDSSAEAEEQEIPQEAASEEETSGSGTEETDRAQLQQTQDASAEEETADAAQEQTTDDPAGEQAADTAQEEQTADAAQEKQTADAAQEQTTDDPAGEQTADAAEEELAADAAQEQATDDPAGEQTADAAGGKQTAEEKTADTNEGKETADADAGQLTAEIPKQAEEKVAEVTVPAAKTDAAAASGSKDKSSPEAEGRSAEETEEISFSVEACWDDEQDHDGLRPSLLTVSLYANGEESGQTVVLHDDNDWTASFSGLPAEIKGEPVAYSIVGEPVSGYVASISGDSIDGYTITNVHVINPTGRSSEEEVDRIRKKADGNRVTAGVTTVTTTKVARSTANYTTAIPRTSTAMVKRSSPKTADAAEPALWAVPLLIGIAGVYVWMRREQK